MNNTHGEENSPEELEFLLKRLRESFAKSFARNEPNLEDEP